MARVFEGHGIPTVCLMSRLDLAEIIKAPRTLVCHFPYGAPLGVPGDANMQAGVIQEALNLFTESKEPGTIRESQYRWRAG
jgi:hypothetical protein